MFSQVGRQRGRAPVPRTVCKICLSVILVGQETVWLTKPMGLSHKACAKHKAGA